MKRPRQESKLPYKAKSINKSVSPELLELVATRARYVPSDYHCWGPNGQRPARRIKPATHCPRDWTVRQGLNAVRQAIRAGQVSKAWLEAGFPRHIWHREGDIWYEARTTDGAPGEYHGYPIEASALPAGIIR